MIRTRSLRCASTETEIIIPPSREDNPIQGEAAKMENGSLKFLCLRRSSGNRRGSCRSLILRLSLVYMMKSQMAQKRKMGIGSNPLLPVEKKLNVPRRRDMARLDPSIVGSRLVVLLNLLQFVQLKEEEFRQSHP